MQDHNINKIVNLLNRSKHALDAAYNAALEYQEAKKDIEHCESMLEDDLEFAKEENENPEKYSARSRERLEIARLDADKAEKKLVDLGKSLEDELGSAGRVSDHFNGKVYPLGMSPL